MPNKKVDIKISLTKKEAKKLNELLRYEKGQLNELVSLGELMYKEELKSVESIIEKLKI